MPDGDTCGYAIGRLSLQPGDVLVVKCNHMISQEVAAYIKKQVREHVGDVPVMVLGSDIGLAVLTKAEIDTRTDPPLQPPERIIDLPGDRVARGLPTWIDDYSEKLRNVELS